jgi:ectoine hydroxylase-related dioxygenase (phytanoyl-CoA dioxygenase family)
MRHVLDWLLPAMLDRSKAGARHVLAQPVVRELAADSRMLDIARAFVGARAVPFRATLFDKSPHANWLVAWHQDTALPLREWVERAGWRPCSMKAGVPYAHAPASALEQVVALRVSLDDSSSANGPLRVLPNTDRLGVLSAAEIERLARERAAVECIAAAGSVVAMRPLTVHASSKSLDRQPRRVLHIEYSTALTLAPGIDLAIC